MSRGTREDFAHLPAWKHGLALKLVEELSGVFADVIIERVNQDEQWGGPDTDDLRGPAEWSEYIHKQLSKMFEDVEPTAQHFRGRFVKVAALAFAAIAAIDRGIAEDAAVAEEGGCGHCPACRLRKFIEALENPQDGKRGVEIKFVDASEFGGLGELIAMLSRMGDMRRGG